MKSNLVKMRARHMAAIASLAFLAPLPARAGSILLGLGDSITFGETDLRYIQSAGDRGYVGDFANFLGTGGPRPAVINLAIDGETASSFFTGFGRTPPVIGRNDTLLAQQNLNYASNPATPQADRLRAIFAAQTAAGNTVDNITITLGFNELAALAVLPQDQALAMLPMTLQMYRTNYTSVLNLVRQLAPNAHLYLLNYFDPFPGDPTVNTADALFAAGGPQLNAIILALSQQFGAKYIDDAKLFVGREAELTYIDEFPAGSTVPPPHPFDTGIAPIGNVHPNDAGYAVIASQVDAASVPEPATYALLAVGLASLICIRRARRGL